MSIRQLKTVCHAIQGISSFASAFYFYYLYFLTQQRYGFGDRGNLILAAGLGFVYVIGSWQGGRFAQRRGYFTSLKTGFITMILALAAGLQFGSAAGLVAASIGLNLGTCFLWPAIEALVSEGETARTLPRAIGIYNVVWAGTNALALFAGGTLVEKFGFACLFYIPLAICISQLTLTFWVAKQAGIIAEKSADAPEPASTAIESRAEKTLRADSLSVNRAGTARFAVRAVPQGGSAVVPPAAARAGTSQRDVPTKGTSGEKEKTSSAAGVPLPGSHPTPRAKARVFLRMAWLANPFAYIAINTLIALLPGVAKRLELSTMVAGFLCSIWCFARLGAFCGLWIWEKWHYRFRWLLAAFLVLIGTFAVILIVPNLATLVAAQLFFGGAVGLIYYSSLFYSMDAGDTKGEHGGIHEAAIGLGNFAGPAVGAVSLALFPGCANSGALAVSTLLLLGLGGLMALWRTQRIP
jgi:predicted MFS family arabinose efflux permease